MRATAEGTIEPARTPRGTKRHLAVAVLTVWLGISWSTPAVAQSPSIDREAKIKAAYLYQFINYVQWPADSFADPQAPLVIGTVGSDPVNRYLEAIAARRTAGGRKLVYTVVDDSEDAEACHILFISDSIDESVTADIIAAIPQTPLLLVGECPGFLSCGGVIGFMIVDNHVRLQISMRAAAVRRLKISSQLAKIAQVVN